MPPANVAVGVDASKEVGSVADALVPTARADVPRPPREMAVPSDGPPIHPHHVNLPSLVANIQRVTHAEYKDLYEARFPDSKQYPPGTELPPLELKNAHDSRVPPA